MQYPALQTKQYYTLTRCLTVTTILVALLSAVSVVNALTGTNASTPDVKSPDYQFPNGRPAITPVSSSESFGEFACLICSWGYGSDKTNLTCQCCYPNGACAGQEC
ncbi:hypothetical protein HBI56_223940 [Parastagonospora nodorum]|nr:hypothetical protein HBH53_134500 [Parastagonospora nodorum]KAH3985500.1 hypothetical protein HBH51_024310 [Parastagonospora nodorum]KAH4216232.1 hypothetical protein HBI06_235440 [Parastagonospora nodorum]KAH4226418.1 hypothetical protein HBI05_221620 [Parastagonospora nodorum]KAH4306210.1 hypothetical protein HBI01_057280 [Parastagonospora nodorum]